LAAFSRSQSDSTSLTALPSFGTDGAGGFFVGGGASATAIFSPGGSECCKPSSDVSLGHGTGIRLDFIQKRAHVLDVPFGTTVRRKAGKHSNRESQSLRKN